MSWLVLPIYMFVVSKKSDFLLEHEVENHIRPNYIITITEIKKTKGGGGGSKEDGKSSCLPEVKKKKLLRQMKM